MGWIVKNGVIEFKEPKVKKVVKRETPYSYDIINEDYWNDLREFVDQRNKVLDYVASITRK